MGCGCGKSNERSYDDIASKPKKNPLPAMEISNRTNSMRVPRGNKEAVFITIQQLQEMINKGSNEKGGDIIPLDCSFSEDTAEVEKLSEINKIDTKNNIDLDNLEQIKKKYFAPDISQENTPSLSNSNLEEKSPSSSVNPHFDCSKKLNRVDIKNEGDLQNAQIKYNCKKDKEIDELYNIINEKPLYHKLWEIVF